MMIASLISIIILVSLLVLYYLFGMSKERAVKEELKNVKRKMLDAEAKIKDYRKEIMSVWREKK